MVQGGWGRQPVPPTVPPRLCPLPLTVLGLVDHPSCSTLTPGGMSRLTHTHFGGVQPRRSPFQVRLEAGALCSSKTLLETGESRGGRGGCWGRMLREGAGSGRQEAGRRWCSPVPALPRGPARWRRRGCGRRRGKSRRSAAGAVPGTRCTRSLGNATKGNTAPPCRRRGECPGSGQPRSPRARQRRDPGVPIPQHPLPSPGLGESGHPRGVSFSPSWIHVSGAW